jgi:DNA-binding transcriptional LysR family regulator
MRGLAPAAVNHIRAAHPKLDVVVHEQEPHESIPLLAYGDLDLLIAQDWVNQPLALPNGLSRAPLMDDVADVALPAGHRLAGQQVIALEALADQRWIVWQPGTVCHDWLMHTLRTQGYEPIVAHTAGEHATQLALVAAGLGAAVIPRLGRGRVPDGVRMVPVQPSLHRHIYALWRTETSRRRAVKAAVAAFQITASPAESRAARPSSRRSSRTAGRRRAARAAPREK